MRFCRQLYAISFCISLCAVSVYLSIFVAQHRSQYIYLAMSSISLLSLSFNIHTINTRTYRHTDSSCTYRSILWYTVATLPSNWSLCYSRKSSNDGMPKRNLNDRESIGADIASDAIKHRGKQFVCAKRKSIKRCRRRRCVKMTTTTTTKLLSYMLYI